ncbi:hypothetical protein EMCRGX_G003829 [Ephydatia muelleri]|eukprot:Em0001g3608a
MKPLCVCSYAAGYKRTLDHLRAWQLKLPQSVKSVAVTLSSRPTRHGGTRLFVYENLPQLKFYNPEVKVNVTRERNLHEAKIALVHDDGASQIINTNGLCPDNIKQKLSECYS